VASGDDPGLVRHCRRDHRRSGDRFADAQWPGRLAPRRERPYRVLYPVRCSRYRGGAAGHGRSRGRLRAAPGYSGANAGATAAEAFSQPNALRSLCRGLGAERIGAGQLRRSRGGRDGAPEFRWQARVPNLKFVQLSTSPRTCSGVRALAFPRKAKIAFGEYNLARTHRSADATPAHPAETWMPEQVRHDG